MRDRIRDALLRLVQKCQKPREGHVTLVVSRIRRLVGDRTRGDSKDTDALAAPLFVTRLELPNRGCIQRGPVAGACADLQDVMKGALDDEACARGVTDSDGHALANEVKRDLGQLADPGEIWPPRVEDGLVQGIVEACFERRISCREFEDPG